MSKAVNDLVAYLAGEPGETADRCRRALADPASDLSQFLASARERTRAAIAEPAFRGLGLSPAACLPADFEAPPAPDSAERSGRPWLPWVVASIAVLVAGLAVWGPWRSGPAPGPRTDDAVPVAARPAAVDSGPAPGAARPTRDGEPIEALPGTDKPVAAAPKPDAGAARPEAPGPNIAGPAPAQIPPAPKPPDAAIPAAKVTDVGRPPTPVNPAADDRAKAVEQLAKRLEAAEARVAILERENDKLRTEAVSRDRDNDKLRTQVASLDRDNTALRTQVGILKQDAAKAAQAHAACETRAAGQQRVIDGLKADAAKLQQQVGFLEAALKARPPIDSGPTKPKGGLQPPANPEKKKP